MKKCFKCGEQKPLADFYKHPMMGDGRLGKCKTCSKRDVRANRKKKIDYYREYDRARGNRQSREYRQEYQKKYPIKASARAAVGYAISRGEINRPTRCEKCGCECALHGHHDDYSKPLDVRWLCPACHFDWHKKNGPGLNGDSPE